MRKPDSLLIDQTAAVLGISRRTVYYRIREGLLQTIRTRCGSQRVLIDSINEQLRVGPRRRKAPSPAESPNDSAPPLNQSPSRCRFRYKPFREIPKARAAASTLPP